MEENHNTENEKKKEKKNGKKDFKSFFNAHIAEFKKIVWPSKDELIKQTITVIVVSLVVGGIIYAYDTGISYGYEKVMDIIQNNGKTAEPDNGTEEETSVMPVDSDNAAEAATITVGGEIPVEDIQAEDATE